MEYARYTEKTKKNLKETEEMFHSILTISLNLVKIVISDETCKKRRFD